MSSSNPFLRHDLWPLLVAALWFSRPDAAGATGQWALAYRLSQGPTLNDVCAIDANTAVAVGNNGTIRRTADAGASWQTIAAPVATTLGACAHYGNAVWAVTADGSVIRSADRGQTWSSPVSVALGDILRDIYVVDGTKGVVCGTNSQIYRTIDGGNSWTLVWGPDAYALRALDFTDTLQGWCVGDSGKILHTADGGATWSLQPSGTTASVMDVSFGTPLVGYATLWVSSNSAVIKTVNGGASWSPAGSTFFSHPTSIAFVDANNGWINRSGTLSKTTDGGLSWTVYGAYVNNVNDFDFVTASRGWAVGGAAGTYIAGTQDGQNWPIQTLETQLPLNTIEFASGSTGWVGGGSLYNTSGSYPDAILRTNDGGATWNWSLAAAGTGISDLQRRGSNDLRAIDQYGIHRSLDGGNTWQFRAITGGYGPRCLSFPTDLVGYVGTLYGGILKTTNGGASWTSLGQTGTYYQSIQFVDASNGWASGYVPGVTPFNAKIVHTANGGATWDVQYLQPGGWTWLYFLDAQHGWAVGVNGMILRTTNGQTWQVQTSGVTEQLNGIYFLDQQRGWAVGNGGRLLSTIDGGTHWVVEPSPVHDDLFAVCRSSSGALFATGAGGAILHYQENCLTASCPPDTTVAVNSMCELSPWCLDSSCDIGPTRITIVDTKGWLEITLPTGSLDTVVDLTTGRWCLGDHAAALRIPPEAAPGDSSVVTLMAVPLDPAIAAVSCTMCVLVDPRVPGGCLDYGDYLPGAAPHPPAGGPEFITCVTTDGDLAYAGGAGALHRIDVTEPWHARTLDSLRLIGWSNKVGLQGPRAYVAGSERLSVVDISSPDTLRLAGSIATGYAADLALGAGYTYLACRWGGLKIVDSAHPAEMAIVGSLPPSSDTEAVALFGAYVCLADSTNGLQVVDVSRPSQPVVIGAATPPREAIDVCIEGGRAFVAGGHSHRLSIYDLTIPAAPVMLGEIELAGFVANVEVRGRYAYVLSDSDEGLTIVDVGTPGAPVVVGWTDIHGGSLHLGESFILGAGYYTGLWAAWPQCDPSVAVPDEDLALKIALELRTSPNPFNPSTTISYSVPVAGKVRLQVYDLRGRLLRTLVDGLLPAGRYELQWNGCDDSGRELPSAVYISRLDAGGKVARGRMTLVR